MKKLFGLFILIGAALVSAPSSARETNVQKKLQELDQKQKTLERQWELEKEKSKDGASVSIGKEGFALKSKDGQYALKLRGLLQVDARLLPDLPNAYGQSTFLARRVRPIFDGILGDRVSFRIMPDFGNGQTQLVDAYIDFKLFNELKLRGGKFKEPVGLERLQPVNSILFPEFAFPTNLVPNRDTGFQIFGDINGGIISYALGVFNGTFDASSNDVDSNDGKDISGRVFVQPFLKTHLEALKGLGVGFATTYGQEEGSAANPGVPSFRTPAQQVFFRYTNDTATPNITLADGRQWRVTPQLYYSFGPLDVLGEYVRSTQRMNNNSGLDEFTHQAYQAAASVALTGEKASYAGIKPKHNFNPKEGHWGAVQVAGRYHVLDVDDDVFPNYASAAASATKATSFGTAVHWHFNENFKFIASYDHTFFRGGAATGDRPAEKAVTTRMQAAF